MQKNSASCFSLKHEHNAKSGQIAMVHAKRESAGVVTVDELAYPHPTRTGPNKERNQRKKHKLGQIVL